MAVSTTVIAALGWALLDFVWQGIAIGALAALGLLALRNARPQARYALGCVALAACLALPLLGVWQGLDADLGTGATATTGAPTSLATLFASAAPATPVASAFDWRTGLSAQLPAIVAAWAAGALLLALRLLLGLGWVARLRAGARLPNSYWQGRFDELAVQIGLRSPVPLRVSDALATPVAAGWWKPIVLVPAALLAGMPVDLLEALLAHELAHVRRRDYLVNLLQGAVETLLFYHPVVWWLSRRVRIERERIADDLASQAIGDPRRLALALQALDAFQRELSSGPARLPRAPGLVLAAHGGFLMSRIQRLVRPDYQRPDWKLALPLAGLAAIGLAMHAAAATPAVAPLPAIASTPAVRAVPAVLATPGVSATPSIAATPVAAPTAVVAATPVVAVTAMVAATPAIAATPAVTATPAVASAAVSRVGEGRRDPYAMVRDGEEGMMLSGDLDDMADVKRTRQHVHGDFLWFRRGGTAYIVQDAALLDSARSAWAPAEEMSKRMEAISGQMRPHSERMEALSAKMQALNVDSEPVQRKMEALGRQMEPLARQQEQLGEKMRALAESHRARPGDDGLESGMQQLQRQMEPLSAQMQQLSREMERQSAVLQKAHEPMEALSQQMQQASAPMEELGRRMEALGKQQEVLTRHADAEVSSLIERALRDGKAVPSREVSR